MCDIQYLHRIWYKNDCELLYTKTVIETDTKFSDTPSGRQKALDCLAETYGFNKTIISVKKVKFLRNKYDPITNTIHSALDEQARVAQRNLLHFIIAVIMLVTAVLLGIYYL